eukprot:CAMPEP_0171151238 /NCGR_PEP_ID=MMETSP0766_2-20121228/149970_1 /TAXON_ID=439317 /ORGANISM="Gambierdiscus australes, Strain CAWD 149" /LENGTH=105 /DNA_ID=CAMNT_0011615151 /DNA_START=636 /DNA_END=953 /DNA_ORIENTATION=+
MCHVPDLAAPATRAPVPQASTATAAERPPPQHRAEPLPLPASLALWPWPASQPWQPSGTHQAGEEPQQNRCPLSVMRCPGQAGGGSWTYRDLMPQAHSMARPRQG